LFSLQGTASEQDGVFIGHEVAVEGSIGVNGLAMYFEGFSWGAEDCPGGLIGLLEIRDPVGAWWQLEYGDCSECPISTSFNGTEWSGEEVCPDVGDMLVAWANKVIDP
jgi:hypothetical protein